MKRWFSVVAVLFVVSLLIAGCSGGGGSSSTPAGGSPTASTVSGTAATGDPIAGATVTLVDSTGAVRTGTTGADGSFQIDSTGLTPPFLLKVATISGDLYSVSANGSLSTTVNLTPLSDIIVRSWYGAQGIDTTSAFTDPATNPPPAPTDVFALGTMVSNLMQPWLEAQGVNTAAFNAITTPFQAGTGTGIDGVISLTSESASGGTITAVINSGGPSVQNPTQQNFTITSSSSGSLTITSTATTVNGTGSPTYTNIAVPTTETEKSALAGIFTTLTHIGNTVNQKGSSLQGSDLAPYVDSNHLNDGQDAVSWENETASFLATGQTLSFYGLQINSLDTTNNVADVSFQISQGGQSDKVGLTMRLVGSSWLVSGNHHVAAVQALTRAWDWGTNYANQGQSSQYTQTTSLVVQDILQNNVVSATVSGPGITGTISVPMVCSYDGVDCGNSHGSSNTQRYFQYDFSYWPAVGDIYTFTLTTTSGGPYTYTATVGNMYGYADGNPVPADYPVITLTNPSSLSFNDLTSGPITVTGTVYIPIWSYTGIEQLHFNLQGPGGTSTDVSNVDINGTWTGTPVPGQANVFTMIIPQVTNNGDCTGSYPGFTGTCYNVTFGGQTGDIQPGGWFGFDANNHATSFSTSGKEIQEIK